MPAVTISRDDVTQIIFTSGRHGGAERRRDQDTATCWRISVPVEREVMKYRKYAWPFHPIRFVNLLPLSHMFGQSMATNVPPMVRGTVIFTRSFNPHDISG
jgi:long-chain acyl-CoA synthetase